MFAWMRRPFASWTEFGEYLVFLCACIAGIFHASWLWIPIGAMVLLLLGWSRYRDLFARAGKIDADWRELAGFAQRHGKTALAFELYARARAVAVVLGAKLGFDCLFMTGAYFFGMAVGWLWGVDAGALTTGSSS
jgi:hypothetical protein